MRNKWGICLSYLYLACFQHLPAEIQELTISWNAFKCQSSCIQQIQQHFTTIKGIKNLKINPSSGVANIEWDPNEPLNYEPFRYAAAAVGININTMRVGVKGKIDHSGNNLILISDKDGSRFHLIGPIHTESGRYTPKYNLDTHPLPQDTIEQLLDIERQGRAIVISGPLFLPSRYPLTLVTEQIKAN